MGKLNKWTINGHVQHKTGQLKEKRLQQISPFTITHPENDSVWITSTHTCAFRWSVTRSSLRSESVRCEDNGNESPTSCCTSASGRLHTSDTASCCSLLSSGCSSTADIARDTSCTCKKQKCENQIRPYLEEYLLLIISQKTVNCINLELIHMISVGQVNRISLLGNTIL